MAVTLSFPRAELDAGDITVRNPWKTASFDHVWYERLFGLIRSVVLRVLFFKTWYSHSSCIYKVGESLRNAETVKIRGDFDIHVMPTSEEQYSKWTAVHAQWEKIYQNRATVALHDDLKDLPFDLFKTRVQNRINTYLETAAKNGCTIDWKKIVMIPVRRSEERINNVAWQNLALPPKEKKFSCTGLVNHAWIYGGIDIFQGQGKSGRLRDKNEGQLSLHPEGIYPEDFTFNRFFERVSPINFSKEKFDEKKSPY